MRILCGATKAVFTFWKRLPFWLFDSLIVIAAFVRLPGTRYLEFTQRQTRSRVQSAILVRRSINRGRRIVIFLGGRRLTIPLESGQKLPMLLSSSLLERQCAIIICWLMELLSAGFIPSIELRLLVSGSILRAAQTSYEPVQSTTKKYQGTLCLRRQFKREGFANCGGFVETE